MPPSGDSGSAMLSSGTIAVLRRRASSELRRRFPFSIFPTSPFSLFSSTTPNSSPAKDADAASVPKPCPPPIRVSLTEFAGRGVFATRRIGAGELIHTAEPLVAHPSPSLPHRVCYYCLRMLGSRGELLAAAPPCGDICYFCSEACKERSKGFLEVERKADWSSFHTHCRMRQLKYPLMAKRLACLVISGGASADYIDILQPANLHHEMILEMEEEYKLLKSAFLNAQIEDTLISFLTKQWYIGVLARLRINSFRIELVGGSCNNLLASAAAIIEGEAAVGNAVYMLPSFYNHDCDPNAHIIWIDNARGHIKVLRDVEAGEELCICYIDISMDHKARQALLAEGFGFQCRCLRCLSGD